MKRNLWIGSSFVVTLGVLGVGSAVFQRRAVVEAAAVQAPRFEVDPMWPKPLPNHWVMGNVIGVSADAQNHIWIIHRAGSLEAKEVYATTNPPGSECCVPAPPVLEFDEGGNLIGHWGGPGQGYDWPESNHGITVDYKGNVWIGGNGRAKPGSQPAPGYYNDNQILTTNPSIPEVQYNLGYIYTQKKDWANAEAAYKKALELKPSYNEASLGLARVYQESGQGDKAVELMNKAAAANEGDAKVQFNLGVFNLNSGKSEEAMAAFQKAAAADPANAEPYFYIGTILVGQNKVPDAVASLEKYLSMNPTNPQNVATAQGLLQALKPKK